MKDLVIRTNNHLEIAIVAKILTQMGIRSQKKFDIYCYKISVGDVWIPTNMPWFNNYDPIACRPNAIELRFCEFLSMSLEDIKGVVL